MTLHIIGQCLPDPVVDHSGPMDVESAGHALLLGSLAFHLGQLGEINAVVPQLFRQSLPRCYAFRAATPLRTAYATTRIVRGVPPPRDTYFPYDRDGRTAIPPPVPFRLASSQKKPTALTACAMINRGITASAFRNGILPTGYVSILT